MRAEHPKEFKTGIYKTTAIVMKQFLSYMIMTLATLWMAGCSDDSLSDGPADQPERGIVIRLSTGDLETRTDLTSQANLQHVTEVYAVLYKGTGDNTTFESVEKLKLLNEDGTYTDWNPSADDYDIQKEDFILPQTATDGLSAGNYTILCIGLDDKSGDTYGLTAETMNHETLAEKWSTLAEAKATLATGKTADDIAHSELFAGWAEFEFEPDNINIVEVEMKRRVAGILCYVTDIPTTINTGKENKSVAKLRLALYTGDNPNNCISLCRKEVEKATDGTISIPDDFGESENSPLTADEGYLTLGKVITLAEEGFSTKTGEDIYYRDKKTLSDGTIIKENALLIGAYVIPTKATDEKVTLKVELLDEGDKVLATFNAKRDGTSERESYNIYPNYIYHIGDKPESDSTEGDQPASLLGKELTVVPKEWTTMPEVDVEFPSVPLMATMDCPTGIFDCVKSEFNITVKKSILNNNWKLTISGDGLYVKGKDGNYTKNYPSNDNEAKEGAILTFVWVDYRDKNSSNQNDPANDYRTAIVKLETLDDQGALVGSNTEELRQYNAVIVSVGDEKRGFRRLNGEPAGWGYWSSAATASTIYAGGSASYDDGKENYINASSKAISGYEGSLIQKSYLPIYEVSEGKLKALAEFWYLPAPDEMTAFLSLAKDNKWLNLLDVKVYSSNASQNRYWTSVGRWSGQSEASYVTSLEKVGYDLYERENKFYARQACHL